MLGRFPSHERCQGEAASWVLCMQLWQAIPLQRRLATPRTEEATFDSLQVSSTSKVYGKLFGKLFGKTCMISEFSEKPTYGE